MSAFGLLGQPEGFDAKAWVDKVEHPVKRTIFRIASWAWGTHFSPAIICKIGGYYITYMLHMGWLNRIKNREPVTLQCFSNLLLQSGLRHSSTDKCFDVLVAQGGYCSKPLMPIFREQECLQKLKITWLFGEKDFFWRSSADTLLSEGTTPHAKVFSVPNSGHHPYIDNPSESARLALSNFFANEQLAASGS